MTIHKEISLEDEICVHLGAHGWLCDSAVTGKIDVRGLASATAEAA